MQKWMYDPDGRCKSSVIYGSLATYDEVAKSGFKFSDPIDGMDRDETYHDGTRVRRRPTMAVTHKVRPLTTSTGISLANLPADALLLVDGVVQGQVDAMAYFLLKDPGTYTVTVQKWPYLDATLEVEAA